MARSACNLSCLAANTTAFAVADAADVGNVSIVMVMIIACPHDDQKSTHSRIFDSVSPTHSPFTSETALPDQPNINTTKPITATSIEAGVGDWLDWWIGSGGLDVGLS